jgi:hypothetical protein
VGAGAAVFLLILLVAGLCWLRAKRRGVLPGWLGGGRQPLSRKRKYQMDFDKAVAGGSTSTSPSSGRIGAMVSDVRLQPGWSRGCWSSLAVPPSRDHGYQDMHAEVYLQTPTAPKQTYATWRLASKHNQTCLSMHPPTNNDTCCVPLDCCCCCCCAALAEQHAAAAPAPHHGQPHVLLGRGGRQRAKGPAASQPAVCSQYRWHLVSGDLSGLNMLFAHHMCLLGCWCMPSGLDTLEPCCGAALALSRG